MAGNQLTADVATVGDIKTIVPGQVQKALIGTVARTDTAAKTLGTIPAGAILLSMSYVGATGSDAGTTATIAVGKVGGSGTDYLAATNVKGAAGIGQYQPTTATPGVGALAAAVQVTATYAETGGASTTGGPWTVVVEYVTV